MPSGAVNLPMINIKLEEEKSKCDPRRADLPGANRSSGNQTRPSKPEATKKDGLVVGAGGYKGEKAR